jgi:2-hydroxychromene-2-carboxylate isomerase
LARSIAVTFDYRCPFAYNAHAAIVAALRGGSDVRFTFHAFSLDQVHVAEDEVPIWERAPNDRGSGVLALEYGIAVRDAFGEAFLDAHLALFAARHDRGLKIQEVGVVHDALASVGLDAAAVEMEVASGRPLRTLATEHREAVDRWAVFGVPTFVEGDEAVFVRFMERGRVDDLERALDLLDWTRLNELKRTRIPR